MKRLKKQTVFALKEFIRVYSPESTPSEKSAMLNEAVKNFELFANGSAGHDCCKGIVPSASGKDLEKMKKRKRKILKKIFENTIVLTRNYEVSPEDSVPFLIKTASALGLLDKKDAKGYLSVIFNKRLD